jgi:hypothetical protein
MLGMFLLPVATRSMLTNSATRMVIAARILEMTFASGLGWPSRAAIRVMIYAAIITPMSGIKLLLLFPIQRSSIAALLRLLFANITAALGVPVPAPAFVVVDTRWQIEPNNNISRTVSLCFLLGWKQRRRGIRDHRTQRRDQER